MHYFSSYLKKSKTAVETSSGFIRIGGIDENRLKSETVISVVIIYFKEKFQRCEPSP